MKFINFTKLFLSLALVPYCLNASAKAASASSESTVTIPLETYLSLIKPKEDVSLTTIESASLSGEFGEKLRLRVTGTSVGHATPQAVLRSSPQFMISKCSGTANLVNRDQMISLLAKEKKFQVDCDLFVKSWGELTFNFGDVLFVASDVIGADSSIEGAKVVIHRKLNELTGIAAEVTVTGRYQVSVLPESTKFVYHFDIHNPNRAKKAYQLNLANGESVTSIETGSEYKEIENGKISFNLSPGANKVQITGAFGATNWKAPVTAALQYLMIQNNPMLQLKIETTAKRISNEDSRMPANFSSSRTYLLDSKSTFSWNIKKLEVIASTGYSIGQALYNMYVPDEGPGIVEAQFAIQNRGTPELAFKVPGRPVYLEIDSQPQVLAKDADGQLLTQIPNGDHRVLVQYKTEKPFAGWFMSINELMVRPQAALSNVSVNIGFAKSWSAVFGNVLTDYFNRFAASNFIAALIAVLIAFSFLKNFDIKQRTKWSLLLLVFALHVLQPGLVYWMFGALAALVLAHHRSRLSKSFEVKSKWQKVGMIFASVVVLLFLYNFGGNSTRRYIGYDEAMLSKTVSLNEMEVAATPQAIHPSNYQPQITTKGMRTLGSATGAGNFGSPPPMSPLAASESDKDASNESFSAVADEGGDFKGLPAKIRIPAAEYNLAYSQGLIDEKVSPSIRFLLVNPKLLIIFDWICAVMLAYLVYRERRHFINFLKLN
jgi:hypothetical protein